MPLLDLMLSTRPHSPGCTTDPAGVQAFTHLLVVLLASQFQGFCRDLHDDTVDGILDATAISGTEMRSILMNGLTVGRGLNRRSADPRTINDDFSRLGANVWVALAASRPEASSSWREGLSILHKARNGVAHDDQEAARAAGWPVQIETVRRWRNLLDEIVAAVDDVVSKEIAKRSGKNPWEGM